jgi:hypothetical protein
MRQGPKVLRYFIRPVLLAPDSGKEVEGHPVFQGILRDCKARKNELNAALEGK